MSDGTLSPALEEQVARSIRVLVTAAFLALAAPIAAQQAAPTSADVIEQLEAEFPTAMVEIDGEPLFRVRGVSAFPAEARAGGIASRIIGLAQDSAFPPASLEAVETGTHTNIMAGNKPVMSVFDADARLERVNRQTLASAYVDRIRAAIDSYRTLRTREYLVQAGVRAMVATLLAAIAIGVLIGARRRSGAALERRLARVRSIAIQSFQIMRAEHILATVRAVVHTVWTLSIAIIAFACLDYVLRQFGPTRAVANRLLDYVVGPISTMARGIANQLPDLVFLVLLFIVIRYLLKLVRMFFDAVEKRDVTLSGFDAEWAQPTYKLVRVLIVVFGLVVAYPYIPGSGSDAFKGISIFIGLVFSLGSSSAIANLIAGYMMTYRRAFKVGDRVKIGSVTGDVVDIRLQATHLNTIKNEEVIVPNSTILNCEVVNFSTLARTTGLILHTTVGIGYETPWRQVEAMLLEAARRTKGLKSEPLPFVLQQALGDFAITYELNGYTANAQAMGPLYTEIHRNILDIFNEYGVQIMTPAYERDPEVPKIVPKEQWFAAPAKLEPDVAPFEVNDMALDTHRVAKQGVRQGAS